MIGKNGTGGFSHKINVIQILTETDLYVYGLALNGHPFGEVILGDRLPSKVNLTFTATSRCQSIRAREKELADFLTALDASIGFCRDAQGGIDSPGTGGFSHKINVLQYVPDTDLHGYGLALNGHPFGFVLLADQPPSKGTLTFTAASGPRRINPRDKQLARLLTALENSTGFCRDAQGAIDSAESVGERLSESIDSEKRA